MFVGGLILKTFPVGTSSPQQDNVTEHQSPMGYTTNAVCHHLKHREGFPSCHGPAPFVQKNLPPP
jgi:hypothetical protein